MNNTFTMAGVMGWPVAHSRSPAIHNHWIRQYNLNGAYGLFPVNPNDLEAAIRGIQALRLAGSNITIPHKVEAMKFMDWVDPLAQRMGAINTIVVQADGALHGFNNDGFGFLESLREAQPSWHAAAGPTVILGAGGAARAIVVSLIDAGATEIRLLNRTRSKADELAEEFGAPVAAFNWSERREALAGAALLINTTNQGMHGQPALDIELTQLPTSALVSDAIYIPLETSLLAAARLRGNTTVNGLGMLLHQARPAFRAWFGVMPEVTPELHQAIIETF
ncbi:shikimate dehydrogenase [Limnohabitans sp. INBF002]|uniref:shikimate dehydrogenase n=1 Tax=Limnohabitans sp. INBF002 TaxID=2986280 RepID=UPI00248F8792|nr:shikimate dehydrogenase [Limnohabitans sp. INBF002]